MSGRFLVVSATLVVLAGSAAARAQTPAKIETAPLDLTPPERFRIPNVLEPSRRVGLTALDDAVVKLVTAPVGTVVKQNQEVAQLDSKEADARLKVAQAVVKQKQAALESTREVKANKATVAQAEAELEAAKAEVEIAQIRVDHCILRAPYAGRILATPLDAGQFVAKGSPVVELADLSTLRAVVPVERSGGVQVGGTIPLVIEGRSVQGKVKALLPPPEVFAPLRDLAASLSAAVVEVANSDGSLEPGLRVRGPWALAGSVATVPAMAVQTGSPRGGAAVLQVIRNDYVHDIPVQVLGENGPERLQVAGAFRSGDAAIVSSTVPLTEHTLVRFGASDPGVQAQAPGGPSGGVANVDVAPMSNPAVAPIGTPGGTVGKAAAKPGNTGGTAKPATKGGAASKGSGVPF